MCIIAIVSPLFQKIKNYRATFRGASKRVTAVTTFQIVYPGYARNMVGEVALH